MRFYPCRREALLISKRSFCYLRGSGMPTNSTERHTWQENKKVSGRSTGIIIEERILRPLNGEAALLLSAFEFWWGMTISEARLYDFRQVTPHTNAAYYSIFRVRQTVENKATDLGWHFYAELSEERIFPFFWLNFHAVRHVLAWIYAKYNIKINVSLT